MMMQDRLEKEKADAKNAVEEYVYEMRNKLCEQYEAYMQEDVSACLSLQKHFVLLLLFLFLLAVCNTF
jgi:hypothetical protein